jgi:hypothetical protein
MPLTTVFFGPDLESAETKRACLEKREGSDRKVGERQSGEMKRRNGAESCPDLRGRYTVSTTLPMWVPLSKCACA